MILRLVLENAPHPQGFDEIAFEGGQLVIGRSDDADIQLDDPDMYVSRRHAILTEEGGVVRVTDASSGGLYIDNAANPLGHGNSAPLEPGMRLRLGDFVFRVETGNPGTAPAPASRDSAFDFGEAEPQPESPKRPEGLPDPFGLDRNSAPFEREKVRTPPRPLDQDDPFELDLRRAFDTPSHPTTEPPVAPPPQQSSVSPFDTGRGASPPFEDKTAPPAAPAGSPFDDALASSTLGRSFFSDDAPSEPAGDWAPEADPFASAFADSGPAPPPEPAPRTDPAPEPPRAAPPPPAPSRDSTPPAPKAPAPGAAPAEVAADAEALRAALYRGMGLDPAKVQSGDRLAEAEEIGARLRDLVEGLTLLLRTRAQEKQKVRVAQTLISNSDVNPLKFVANTDEALMSLVAPRGQGYLSPRAAVHEAYRDLVDHQVRTWAALQSALRRMIDRFEPSELEREIEDTGLMEKLIAGGRSAKLWQLYVERYNEIARSAEEQFLGEVGRDFREAYEDKGRP